MAAISGVPHPFPYQGSKRQLASQIVGCIPAGCARLIEPFAGAAAISLASAYRRRARRFWINDIHQPLVDLWKAILNDTDKLAAEYEKLWRSQRGRERAFYDVVRDRFNRDPQPRLFLYLLARCVKAAVRYNGDGEFNNSPDNRRVGMHPGTMRQNLCRSSALLRGRTRLTSLDYGEVLSDATSDDVVYMDPPYQGVCDTRDHRYCLGVRFHEFVEALAALNRRRIPYIVSYDGRTGSKRQGQLLPDQLQLEHLELEAGPSTQATLLGKRRATIESLYLSPALMKKVGRIPESLAEATAPDLFAAV